MKKCTITTMKHLPEWIGIYITLTVLISCSSVSPQDGQEVPIDTISSSSEASEVLPTPIKVKPASPEEEPSKPSEKNFLQEVKNPEYTKAVGELNEPVISEDQYLTDKKEVMNTILELASIMKEKDYTKWLSYVSPKSLQYWSNPKNLIKAASRLPVKGLELNSLKDYFLYIFIPSRQNRQIDQIKYISPTLVKAIQTNGDKDIIFYHFEKIGSEWKISLDQLSN